MIHFSRYLHHDLPLVSVFQETIQGNAYFCHSENILLSMLTKERRHILGLPCRRILTARRENTGGNATSVIGRIRVPHINCAAEDHTDLVYWTNMDRFDPPLLKGISDEHLQILTDDRNKAQIFPFSPDLPCHTQVTER